MILIEYRIRVRVLNPMTDVLIRRPRDDPSTEGVSYMPRNERVVGNNEELEKAGRIPLESLPREHGSAHTFLLDFESPEVWENKFLWSLVTQFMVFCYGNPRKLIQPGLWENEVGLILSNKTLSQPMYFPC